MAGIVIATGTAVSVGANTKSADQVTGTFQFLPFNAYVQVYARCSATGMNIQMFGDGAAVVNDLALPWTGTAGAISKNDHEVAGIPLPAGTRLELYLRNTTGGALTNDYIITATPI